jgi:mRNA interferase RelE/StbE
LAWAIEFTKTAERDLSSLDREVQRRIVKFLRDRIAPADDPRKFGKSLTGKYAGLWRYRVGDYRLICEIRDDRLVVLIVVIAHRREAYR